MSISNTVLVYVVIPAAIITVVASLVFAGSDRTRRTKRYRPGRPYDFQPIWFLASPEQVTGPAGDGGHHARAIEGPVLSSRTGAAIARRWWSSAAAVTPLTCSGEDRNQIGWKSYGRPGR